MKHVVIIGGGITGLAAAHRLTELCSPTSAQFDVTLIEAGARLGGIIQTEERDGFLLERGPDAFISEKPEAFQLAKRIGVENHLIKTCSEHRRSFVVCKGSLVPVPEGFHLLAPSRLRPFMMSDIFSWAGKARIALDLVLPKGNANGSDDESLAHFVRRRLGREALDRMAQPMVAGIYTADPEELSLRATMPRFLEMERRYRSVIRALRKQGSSPTVRKALDASGVRYILFLSFDRGMQVLVEKLAERISPFVSIKLNTPVKSLALERETAAGGRPQWRLITSRNETLPADAICLTIPSYQCARLLRDIDAELASDLEAIPYASTATINLAYKREDIPHPLDGFGFVVPFIEKRTLMACTFSSVKFAGRAPAGHALLRAFVGGALQPELFELDGDEMIRRVLDDLRSLLGIERPPLFAEVMKWPRSMPQYHVGHIERVKRIEQRLASLPGLVLAGNAFKGIGIPDCIKSGEAAAYKILYN